MHTTRVIQAALDNDSANSRRKLRNLSQRGTVLDPAFAEQLLDTDANE